MSTLISRRSLLKSALALAATTPLAAACQPMAPQPGQPAIGGTAAPAAAPKKVPLSLATYAGPRYDWQRTVAQQWQEQHPDVELEVVEVPYGEMNKKQLALLATGNLWDVTYSGIKWYPYSVIKGCFLPLDDLVAAKDPGMDDFIGSAVEACRWEDKLYGLPYLLHAGNVALIAANLDMLGEKGIDPPTDETTFDEYLEICIKAADPENRLFSTNYMPGNFYDIAPFMSFGSNVLDDEGKKFLVGADEKATAAAQWVTDLRAKHHVAPRREEAEGVTFQAGLLATRTMGSYYVEPLKIEVADKFKYSVTLHPVGPAGIRGWQPFVEMYSVFSGSKHPDLAYDLTVAETSKEAGIMQLGQLAPAGRNSSWAEAGAKDGIYNRVLAWMNDTPSKFPMPYNVRFQELQDTWANNAHDIFYGEVPFEEGIENLRKRCQAVLNLPRP